MVDGRPIMQATALGRGVSVADLVIDPVTGEVDRTRTTHRNLPVFNERSDAALKAAIIAAEPAPYAQALREARPVPAIAERIAAYSAAAAPLSLIHIYMTAGRGYMALAAMIFGKWHPVGALWACLLFGFLDAVSIRMQGAALPFIGAVPVQAIQALPYVLTVVLLAGFIGNAIAPKALGRPYVKER